MMNDASTIKAIEYIIKDKKITGLACGNPKAKPVLCLHGWLDNAASFLPFMSALSQEQLQSKYFIAIDWPGHGQSDHRGYDAHYHFFDYVYDLVVLFEECGCASFEEGLDIFAHSMGGMIASAFAAAYPEKVSSLSLIDSFGFMSLDAEDTTQQLRKGMLSRTKIAQSIIQNKQRSFSKDTAVKARVAVSDLSVDNASLLVERSLMTSEKAYCWRSDPRLRAISPYRITHQQAQQLMCDLKCPVQLIYGDKGLSMIEKNIEGFSHLVNDFSMIKVSGGHHVHMEQPTILANSLFDFWLNNTKKNYLKNANQNTDENDNDNINTNKNINKN